MKVLNPEYRFVASSFDELLKEIRNLIALGFDAIQGRSYTYAIRTDVYEIAEFMQAYKKFGKILQEHFTRNHGLRDAIKRCISVAQEGPEERGFRLARAEIMSIEDDLRIYSNST